MISNRFQKISLGDVINERYIVRKYLGEGAVATVFQVHDSVLDVDTIALKILSPSFTQQQKRLRRFKNEALAMKLLNHANIVRIHDFGETPDGLCYISMEYVEGRTLADLIQSTQGRRLDFAELLRILHQICLGMIEAHMHGIIHRDLKPENILLTELGDIKIADFGLAHMADQQLALTTSGETLGTPHYSSPEQLQGKAVDTKSDIYSFGIIAFELATGKVPFEGETYFELAEKHLSTPIPEFTKKDPSVPLWFQEFVIRCTAKSPGKRYKSFKETEVLLRAFLSSESKAPLKARIFPPMWALLSAKLRLFTAWINSACAQLILLLVLLALCSLMIARSEKNSRAWWVSIILRIECQTNLKLTPLRKLINWEVHEGYAGVETYLTTRKEPQYLKALLESCVDPNGIGPGSKTPFLFIAAEKWDPRAAQILIEQGADINLTEPSQNRVVLMHLIGRGNLQMTEMLLKEGALEKAVVHRDIDGRSIYNYLFGDYKDSKTAKALPGERIQMLHLLIDQYKAPLEITDSIGKTPVILAALLGTPQEVNLLLEAGANPNVKCKAGYSFGVYLSKRMHESSSMEEKRKWREILEVYRQKRSSSLGSQEDR